MRRRGPAHQPFLGLVLALLTALAATWFVHPAEPHTSRHEPPRVPATALWDTAGPLLADPAARSRTTTHTATSPVSWDHPLADIARPQHTHRGEPVRRAPGDTDRSTAVHRASPGQERAPPPEPIS